MRWVIGMAVVVALVVSVRATPAKLNGDELAMASYGARAELDACVRQAGAAVGDVVVDDKLSADASKSLGASGPAIAACVRDALKAHYHRMAPYTGSAARPLPPGGERFVFPIGAPTQVLPPIQTFMPVWRAALAPNARQADRDALARLIPPDYAVVGRCLRTDRDYARKLEATWLGGLRPITHWSSDEVDAMGAHRHQWAGDAAWADGDLVARSTDGVCVEPFDPVAARAVFDRDGSCWVGSPTDILLDPRVAFPNGPYTQIATRNGRACALTSQGALTCCGRADPRFGTPPAKPLRQIAVADDFACGLDDAGIASCWGSLTAAPTRPFTKLVAGRGRACGLHGDGSIECWPETRAPKGTFVDVAVGIEVCGVHPDGTMACLDGDHPPGRWASVALGGRTVCGLRYDQSVGCTEETHFAAGMPMFTPVAEAWPQLAIAEKLGACGIRRDGTIACSDLHAKVLHPRGMSPPTGTFTRITAGEAQFCATSTAGAIACWGDLWPQREPPPLAQPRILQGKIVDEHGAPIANASVEIERKETVLTTADGTWTSWQTPATAWITVTAAGHEIASRYGDRATLAAPIWLRPATTVTIDATCAGKPCWSMVERDRDLEDSKLEHVAPGNYRLRAWRDHGSVTEQLAVFELEVPFAAKPQTLHPALIATGAGHTLRVSLHAKTKDLLYGARAEVTCANGALRRDEVDDRGNIELRNLPELPCRLRAGSALTLDADVELTSYKDLHFELTSL